MYGEISVEMLSESESPEWTIRKFRLGYVSTSLSTSGSGAVVGSEVQAHYQPLEAALTNCVFCDVWSLSPPAGWWESGRPPPELHLVAGSRRPHGQRHREHPAVRLHRPSAGQQDQRPHHRPLQVRLESTPKTSKGFIFCTVATLGHLRLSFGLAFTRFDLNLCCWPKGNHQLWLYTRVKQGSNKTC